MKVIDLDMFERNQIDELRRETALMALSKHPNVLRVYGSFVTGSKLYIITPYLSAGSCLDIMKTAYPDGFDEISIATILKQALEGLVYLHKNGHIHRDVKAGNLLMDDHGVVQLADFGVSSSLTENNEVRKTFVGTPCWMAPEVMEQAGYDFKADIWSFGITAIELATGHAPFAKYAPMKVLMMTLSQDPPTLSRETAKHKFSKLIKEMIDTCLQKDPKKRPSAEKLLLHPFFRQAKKKDFLVKTILANVPALDKRPHKKVPQKHVTVESTDKWDFDTLSDDDVDTPKDGSTSNSNTPATTSGNGKKHISFGNVVIKSLPQQGNNKSSPLEHSNSATSSPASRPTSPDLAAPTPQRKSRFVVGENGNDQLNTTQSQRSMSSVNEQSVPRLSSNMFSPSEKDGVGLGISGNTMTTPLQSVPSSTSSLASSSSGQEVKKGRFSVNQNPQRTRSISATMDETDHTEPSTTGPATAAVMAAAAAAAIASPASFTDSHDIKPIPVARIGSSDGLRKSRFAVHHSPMAPTSAASATETPPLSRNASINNGCPATPGGGNKVSRFSTAKDDPAMKENGVGGLEHGGSTLSRDSSIHSHDTPNSAAAAAATTTATTPSEGRKKGRFQVSGLGDMKFDKDPTGYLESPQSSVSSYSPNSSFSRGQSARFFVDHSAPSMVYAHMENLYKQTEAQKNLLHDMLAGLSLLSTRPAHTDTSTSRSRSGSLNSEIAHTLDHLQHLLQVSSREREQLQRENDGLRRELDRLRRSANGNSKKSEQPASVVDPLPPPSSTAVDTMESSRPHTTSPVTIAPSFDVDKPRTPSSTIHSTGNHSIWATPPPAKDDAAAEKSPARVTYSSVLPTPSSSYSWTSKPTDAPEALSDFSSP
ncbi:unnamed protein product [Absidia cylindrospora]